MSPDGTFKNGFNAQQSTDDPDQPMSNYEKAMKTKNTVCFLKPVKNEPGH